MTYDPTTPVDLVFGKIDDLLMYGDFASCLFTATQAITKGHHILNNCENVYNDYLPLWNRIPETQKTWNRFKTHFCQAYTELEATTGQRNNQDGLRDVNFQSQIQQSHLQLQLPSPTANVILRHNMSDSNLAVFIHAAAGCPTKATFIAAIQNGNFTTWPGLNTSLIAKHLLPSIATGKGHMKQEQQRLQSTRLESPITPDLPSSEDSIVQE